MKAKHVITTFVFAATMALGVAGGLSRAKVEQADAAGVKTLYCKMTYDWWTVDGAAVGVYYWKDTGGHTDNGWPGTRGTAVDGDPGVWKFEIPDNMESLIFTRVNGSGDIDDWGAKTSDLDMPTGDNNLYTITSSSPVFGDPGVTGEWSHYDEPDPEEDHTYSFSLNGGEFVNLVEHEGNEVKTAEKVTMAVGDTITFKKDGEAFAVTPKDDDALTKVFSNAGVLTAAVAVDEVLYLNTSTAKLWAGQFPEGYFLLGVGDNWNAKLGLAAEKESEGDAYFVKNVVLAAEAEIKMIKTPASGTEVTYYDANAEKVATSSEVAFEVTEEYHNLKVTNAGTYDVYYNPTSGWYSIEDTNYEPTPVPDPEYYIAGSMNDWTKGEGYILNKTEETPEGFVAQYALEDFDLTAADEFKITDGTAYFGFDRLEANVLFEGADDGLGGENIKALLTAQYDIFLKVAADPANTKIYIGVDMVDADKVNKNTFYVYDMGGVLGDDIAKLNIFGFGQAANINPMEYPGVHDGDYVVIEEHEVAGIEHLYKVQLSVSFTKFIVNNGNGEGDRQTTNIEEIKAGQVYYIYTDADLEGKYPGAWYSLDDLGVENGTYIRGDWGDGWAVKGQKTMHTNPGEGKEHEQMIEGLLLSAGSKLKVVCYTDHVPAWHGATEVYLGEDQLVDAIDEDGNAIVPNDGSYNLYVDTNTWIYYFTISENEALAKALEYVDLFHSTLRAEGVCDVEHGKTTNVEALATAWATLKTEYGKITLEGAKELLVAGTENAELVAFAKLYDMIIAKYSAHLGADANFLNRSSSSAADVVAVNATVDNTAILIALVATISSIALVASVLVIKKRKASK